MKSKKKPILYMFLPKSPISQLNCVTRGGAKRRIYLIQ